MDERRARRAAHDLRMFWARQGYTVEARVVRQSRCEHTNTSNYAIQSDMVGGWPRDHPKGVAFLKRRDARKPKIGRGPRGKGALDVLLAKHRRADTGRIA